MGWDNLPSYLIQENIFTFTPILTYLINLSLTQGIFPAELKVANILPIFKAGIQDLVGNYRPISLLTSFSKMYERVFCIRLNSFIKKYKILYELQFGFRESHSTYLAMITLLDQIISSLDKNHFTIGLFLDFSKAFDTVNHKILLDKLEYYGIRGVANKWIESYLSERKQYTTYNGHCSPYTEIRCGVPQGSILGPILFILYINDLGTISEKIATIMFADDSNLFASGSDLKTIENLFNTEIPNLVTWLRVNRLSLNIKKTHFMVFGPKLKKNIPGHINILIEGNKLDRVDSTKFLGVTLDSDITWKPHIASISNKVAKSIGVLSLARKTLNMTTSIQLYYSFVYPYLTYCTPIWAKASDSTLWPIYRLQKIAIRIIGGIRKGQTSRPFCKKHSILHLPEIYKLCLAIFMYKYHYSKLPPTFNYLFNNTNQFHNYPTRNAHLLRVPRTKTKLAQNFVTTQGALLWNDIKNKIDTNSSISVFKKNTIKLLISPY